MKFSIIMPIFNIQQYLKKGIESILNQTYTKFELILVDDGSTDNSLKICKNYQKNDNRITIIHKKNGGLSDARNCGLEKATGDYLLFIDGDDFIRKDTLEIIEKNIRKHQYDILIFGHYTYNNETTKEYLIDEKNWEISDDKKYIITLPSACCRAYKTIFLKKLKFRFIKNIIYEDLASIPGLINYTQDILFLDDFLYFYVTRSESIMNNKTFQNKKDDKFIALEKLEEDFKKNKSIYKYKDEIEYLYIKHLLIMYSIEILTFNRNIYRKRLNKAVEVVNKKYPNWYKNKYLMKKSSFIKIYLFFLKNKCYLINKIFVKIRMREK